MSTGDEIKFLKLKESTRSAYFDAPGVEILHTYAVNVLFVNGNKEEAASGDNFRGRNILCFRFPTSRGV